MAFCLDGPASRNANPFAEKKTIFHNVRAIRANRLKPAIRNLSPAKRDSQKKGVQCGNPEMIRENQKICANLRVDSRESGHLRPVVLRIDFVLSKDVKWPHERQFRGESHNEGSCSKATGGLVV